MNIPEVNLNGFIKFPTKSQKKFKSIKWKVKGEEYVGGIDDNDPNPHVRIPLSIKGIYEGKTYTLLEQTVKIYIECDNNRETFTTYPIRQQPPMTGEFPLTLNGDESYKYLYIWINKIPIEPVCFHWQQWIEGDIFYMWDKTNDIRLIEQYGFPDPRTLGKIELVFEITVQ